MSGPAAFRRFHNCGRVKRVVKEAGRVLCHAYLLNHAVKSRSRFSIAGRAFQQNVSLTLFTRTSGENGLQGCLDRKSTRLNSSHPSISYAVFCLKKKKNK